MAEDHAAGHRGQVEHLKSCRSMAGTRPVVSPRTNCIKRISAPQARHCIAYPLDETDDLKGAQRIQACPQKALEGVALWLHCRAPAAGVAGMHCRPHGAP